MMHQKSKTVSGRVIYSVKTVIIWQIYLFFNYSTVVLYCICIIMRFSHGQHSAWMWHKNQPFPFKLDLSIFSHKLRQINSYPQEHSFWSHVIKTSVVRALCTVSACTLCEGLCTSLHIYWNKHILRVSVQWTKPFFAKDFIAS